ncbi:MAG: dCTP deaminase [Armatimonadetes bacterium CG2_30_66_41]|nr:MAG: dCTP deaminase [Armatimonadetes bacterium CG2_30_66_41]
MILNAARIADMLREGQDSDTPDPLVITPTASIQEIERSGSASVDLRLGTWLAEMRHARITHLEPAKPEPEQDEKTHEVELTKLHYVRYGSRYLLHPGNFVLGATLEWIRVPSSLAGYIVGKSSWGRRGLVIATAAGVHPGFKGCLTLELSNVGEVPVALEPGMRTCQLFLHRVEKGHLPQHVDTSHFIGLRQPALGHVRRDAVAQKLASA